MTLARVELVQVDFFNFCSMSMVDILLDRSSSTDSTRMRFIAGYRILMAQRCFEGAHWACFDFRRSASKAL